MNLLRVAQIVAGTEAEGPGVRYALWVQGCSLACPGCCNPHMWRAEGGDARDPVALADDAASRGVEGITLLGGEPFEQADAAASFARASRARGLSVMVFSGFTLAELAARDDDGARALLASTDLLVDGRYDRSRRDRSRRWIGSENQVLHFLSDRYAPDDPRLHERNTVELRLGPGGLSVNGWPEGARVLARGR